LRTAVERAKKEIADLKAKLDSAKDTGLTWEAKRLLQLYAQDLSDWQQGESRKPWRQNYQEALDEYGEALSHPETLSQNTVYMLGFMASFRGYPDREKQWQSELMFWLLACAMAPKACEELILHKGSEHLYSEEDLKARRELLNVIDRVLTKPDTT